jgi:hypothetical protein
MVGFSLSFFVSLGSLFLFYFLFFFVSLGPLFPVSGLSFLSTGFIRLLFRSSIGLRLLRIVLFGSFGLFLSHCHGHTILKRVNATTVSLQDIVMLPAIVGRRGFGVAAFTFPPLFVSAFFVFVGGW